MNGSFSSEHLIFSVHRQSHYSRLTIYVPHQPERILSLPKQGIQAAFEIAMIYLLGMLCKKNIFFYEKMERNKKYDGNLSIQF